MRFLSQIVLLCILCFSMPRTHSAELEDNLTACTKAQDALAAATKTTFYHRFGRQPCFVHDADDAKLSELRSWIQKQMQNNQEWQEYVVNCYRSYYRHYHVSYDLEPEPIITIEQTPQASRRWLHARAP